MNKVAFAIIAKMEGKDKWEDQTAYPYVAQTTEGTSPLILEGGEELDDNDIGTPCLICYMPDEQFCHLIPIETVRDALSCWEDNT